MDHCIIIFNNRFQRGSRIIILDDNTQSFTTYCRNADGTIDKNEPIETDKNKKIQLKCSFGSEYMELYGIYISVGVSSGIVVIIAFFCAFFYLKSRKINKTKDVLVENINNKIDLNKK